VTIRFAAALLALATLAACGLKGGLERPPPEFGEARRAYEAETRAKAEAAAQKAKEDEEKQKQRQTTTIPVGPASPVSPPPTATPK
jgi:predicted small lipoprotein YifL